MFLYKYRKLRILCAPRVSSWLVLFENDAGLDSTSGLGLGQCIMRPLGCAAQPQPTSFEKRGTLASLITALLRDLSLFLFPRTATPERLSSQANIVPFNHAFSLHQSRKFYVLLATLTLLRTACVLIPLEPFPDSFSF
jgi:hypothetical protein